MILSPFRGALLCASILLGSTVTAQAQLQNDAACAFSAFPLSQNFGSFPTGLGGDSVRCGAIRMQGAINALNGSLQAFPGLTANVASTGTPGMDNLPGFFLYQRPSSFVGSSALRVQREVPDSPASTSGNTYKSIWGVTYTSPTQAGYEWSITGELHNRTQGSTGAQNVAVNGTAFKETGTGSGQIGPTWASNFACDDRTGQVNPTWSCIGSEIDTYTTANGNDANRQRVAAQIVGGSLPPSTGAHIGYGILMNTARSVDVIDRGYAMTGAFGIGLDTTQATFSVAPILLGVGQRIAMDGNATTGAFNRSFMWSGGSLYWTTPSGNVFSLTDGGSTAQLGSATISGGVNTPSVTTGSNSGVLLSAFVRNTDPTTNDIPAGQCADWNNTAAGTYKHVCNFAGTLRSVAMQ